MPVQPHLDAKCKAWRELTDYCRYWLEADRAVERAVRGAGMTPQQVMKLREGAVSEYELPLPDTIDRDGDDAYTPNALALAVDAARAALAEQPEQPLEPAPGYCKHCKQYTIEEPLAAQPEQAQWVSVADQMPDTGRIVLACYVNSNNNIRRVRAKWVAAKTAESGSESDIGEYDEESDCYYDSEGWYECIDNWDDYNAVAISDPVTHWMPLPAPPEDKP